MRDDALDVYLLPGSGRKIGGCDDESFRTDTTSCSYVGIFHADDKALFRGFESSTVSWLVFGLWH